MNLKIPSLATLAALAGAVLVPADTSFDAPGNFNPLIPGYFADPTVKQFGDTFHLYATTDGNGGGRGPATVWVSHDFVNWVLVPMNWPATPHYWAPDVVHRPDGRYYLYYSQPCSIYGAVADSPVGPWTPLTPGDGLIIPDRLVPDVITLDAQFFTDRDGTLYAHWGTWGIFPNSGCGFGVVNPDMKSFARLGMIPNTQAKEFFEAPFMIERNGVYYLTYSSGSCHDASYRVQYAVSDRPDGEFRMGPNNPILATSADRRVHGPGHHSILQHGDVHYIVYHRHDIPVTPNGMHRQTCADRLIFDSDGVIRQVEPTHRGIGYLGPRSRPVNLAFNAAVTASSHYHDTLRQHRYRPEHAVDDNNATLWRPADNRPGHWLQVDLGRTQPVRRTEIQFEYGTWAYQYLIEASVDGENWQTFADRRHNTRWGSPLVDDGDLQARFLRLTVTGTEFPGLFGAVWNFKAYAEATPDPLLDLADHAFQHAVTPTLARQPAGETRTAGPNLLIHLDAADLPLGAPVSVWTNQGSLGGTFHSRDAWPVVDLAEGRQAVRFSGSEVLTASFPAPRFLAGNSSYTVALWVHNPEIGESECLVSWGGRGGPDATTAQFGYGSHPAFGAVGHWGFADLGFQGGPPPAGKWHHLAVTFDGVIERLYVNGRLNHAAAKMLLVHAGRPIHVGASEPGAEHFDGHLASLRVYDRALDTTQIAQLAAQPPAADVWVQIDSARLDYGPLEAWPNRGSLGGAFIAGTAPPQVRDVNGRIAVSLCPGETLEWQADTRVALDDFTLLVGVAGPASEPGPLTIELVDAEHASHRLVAAPSSGTWQWLAWTFHNGQVRSWTEAEPAGSTAIPALGNLARIRLEGGPGAWTRLQLFQRALSGEELTRLHDLWRGEQAGPTPDPASFSQPPVAVSPHALLMQARPGRSTLGPVEYRFHETTGHPDAPSSGWISIPHFLVDGLNPDTLYAYAVALRDRLGNVTASAAPVPARTDTAAFDLTVDQFDIRHDFLARGPAGTMWDGCLDSEHASAPEVIAVLDDGLRLQSSGTVWDGGQPRGAFLFKLTPHDFVAEAVVADYAGLATRRVPGNNDGGLMVRVPGGEQASSGDDLVQLNFFPIWNQGNMVTVLHRGRRQTGNRLAWDAHRHLQIIRQNGWFYFRTSADGLTWQEMPGSPVERPDLAGQPLQVGPYHASYGGGSSHIIFSAFRLTTRR